MMRWLFISFLILTSCNSSKLPPAASASARTADRTSITYSQNGVFMFNGRLVERQIVLKDNQPVFLVGRGWGIEISKEGRVNPNLIAYLERRFDLPSSKKDITKDWTGMREIELQIAANVPPDKVQPFLDLLKNRGIVIIQK
jgi:hypothetical protein